MFFFGFGLLGLLIAVVMFYFWRLWLRLHGQTWKPSGKWESRTTAMHDHLATQPGMTRSQKITMVVTIIATLSGYAVIVAFVLTR